MHKWIFYLLMGVSPLYSFEPTLPHEVALKKLIEGNERFSKDNITCPERTQERRLAVISKQDPFAVIVGCSDSRVSPDLVFDQGVGDLFVVRDAGNIVGATELDSIEYGVTHLHAGLVLVLGHTNCGAVSAVLSGNTHDIETIASMIQPAIKNILPNEPDALEKAVKANVLASVKAIRQSPQLEALISKNKIKVLGGYYDLKTGKVTILQEP